MIKLKAIASDRGVSLTELGTVGGERLLIDELIDLELSVIREALGGRASGAFCVSRVIASGRGVLVIEFGLLIRASGAFFVRGL